MTATEKFQIVAAVAAGLATLGFLIPGRTPQSAAPRHLGSLGVLVASWFMLGGSLISRHDASRGWDRISSLPRIGIGIVALAVAVGVTILLVRVLLARPVLWFVLLALALPIRIPITVGSQSANLLVPLYAVVGLGILVWVIGRRTGRFTAPDSRSLLIDGTTALFTAMSLISAFWSDDLQEATTKIVSFYIPFLILFRLVAALWPVAHRPLRALVTTTAALGVAVAILAIWQHFTETIWWNDTLKQANVYNRFFRANGIFFDPNILGRFLALAIVTCLMVLVVTRTSRQAVLLVAASAVMAGGLAVTFSRSSSIMLMIAIFIVSLRAFGVKRTLVVTVGAAVLIGGPAMALKSNVREKFTSVDELISTGGGRFDLAEGGVDLWRTAPLQGVGLGAFAERYEETFSKRERDRTRVFISHTAPVTVLAELGAIGFGFLILMCIGTLAALIRASRPRGQTGLMAWTVLALLIGIFVHSLLYSALFEDPYVWTLLGIGAVLLAASRNRPVDTGTTAAMPKVEAPPTT